MTTIPIRPQLNERESRFVHAILNGATRAEAARLAGYGSTPQSQRVQGSRMMKRVKIKLAIDEARKARDQQETSGPIMDGPEVLAQFTYLARHGETERTRLDAIGQMARHHGLLSDTLKLQQDQRRKGEHEQVRQDIAGRLGEMMEQRDRERRERRDGKPC